MLKKTPPIGSVLQYFLEHFLLMILHEVKPKH